MPCNTKCMYVETVRRPVICLSYFHTIRHDGKGILRYLGVTGAGGADTFYGESALALFIPMEVPVTVS